MGIRQFTLSYFISGGSPTPDIKANDSDGPITLETSDTLSVKVSLAAGTSVGTSADWWVAADTPFGWFYFDVNTFVFAGASALDILVTLQAPLFDLAPPFEILNIPVSVLPPGTYAFYFAVDTNMNGVLDFGELFLILWWLI